MVIANYDMKRVIQWDPEYQCIRVFSGFFWIVDSWGAISLGLVFFKAAGMTAHTPPAFNVFFLSFFVARLSRALITNERGIDGLAGWMAERVHSLRLVFKRTGNRP